MKKREVVKQRGSQAVLPGTPEAQEQPLVRDGQMLVNFVRPRFDIEKDERIIGFEISTPITSAHGPVLPPDILEGWNDLQANERRRRIDFIDIPPQTVELRLAPDGGKEPDLHLIGASIDKASLAVIEETGSGDAKKVIRFSFVVTVDLEPAIGKFAQAHYGKQLWIRMAKTQRNLLEKAS